MADKKFVSPLLEAVFHRKPILRCGLAFRCGVRVEHLNSMLRPSGKIVCAGRQHPWPVLTTKVRPLSEAHCERRPSDEELPTAAQYFFDNWEGFSERVRDNIIIPVNEGVDTCSILCDSFHQEIGDNALAFTKQLADRLPLTGMLVFSGDSSDDNRPETKVSLLFWEIPEPMHIHALLTDVCGGIISDYQMNPDCHDEYQKALERAAAGEDMSDFKCEGWDFVFAAILAYYTIEDMARAEGRIVPPGGQISRQAFRRTFNGTSLPILIYGQALNHKP